MPPLKTKPGTPKLSERARKVVAPEGIVATGWPAVETTCRDKLGLTFDPWQSQSGRLILAKRADGTLACMVGGVGLAICRQAGKTHLIAGMIFGLCVNQPGLLVIWSAHHAKTHGETFLAMQSFAERLRVAPYIEQVFTGSGDEEVRFTNGSRILFGARERGFGRGIPGVDVIVADEAQIMTERAVDAQLATVNTSRFGLVIYAGTPPRPEDPSEAWMRMRTQAWNGTLLDAVWIEFGAEPGDDPNDRAVWARMNPSYPHRTPAQSILRLQRKLTAESFLREGMGIYVDDADTREVVFDLEQWEKGVDTAPALTGSIALALSRTRDRSKWALAAAQFTAEGRVHLELGLFRTASADDVVRFILAVVELGDPVALAIDSRDAGVSLVPLLAAAGVEPEQTNTAQIASACGGLMDDAEYGRISHTGQADVLDAVDQAARRFLPQGDFVWDESVGESAAPLRAITLARWALLTFGNRRTTPASPTFGDTTTTTSRRSGELDLLTTAF